MTIRLRVSMTVLLVLSMFALAARAAVQNNPPNWALDRIDQASGPLDASYSYTTTGQGVHIYVVDSGINASHTDFTGRVVLEKDWIGDPAWPYGRDCLKHGTAVASTAAGTVYGVAKQATIHVHKVVGCAAAPDNDDVLLALELHNYAQALGYILWHHQNPAVVNLSYTRMWNNATACSPLMSPSYPNACGEFRQAIENLVANGVPVVVAAGNRPGPVGSICWTKTWCDPYWGCSCNNGYTWNDEFNVSAMTQANDVVVVGAGFYGSPPTGYLDHRVAGTKYDVDVYAPGQSLLVASTESPTATQYFHNTSAAAAVVTGVIARYLETHPFATPAQINNWILANGSYGTIDYTPIGNRNYLYMSPLE